MENSEETNNINNSNKEITLESIERHKSKLGEVNYWDELYKKENQQFKNNNNLGGEVWFGETVQDKVLNYIYQNFENKEISILDIGCGNCEFLIELINEEYTNLTGIDYSNELMNFINEKLSKKQILDKITFKIADLNKTNELSNIFINKKFELLHDKGTFDAFMLSSTNDHEKYIENIISVSDKNACFIITSCNFTKDELLVFFKNEKVVYKKELPHKKFQFGGQSGQTVTTLVFEIKS